MANYGQNLGKEVKQLGSAWLKAWQTGGEVGKGTDERANMLRRKQDKALGQLAGAVLQGRRYDDRTGKQIKAAPANARKLVPGAGPTVRIAKKAAAKKKSM
jgi:hypothetical protein